MADLGLVFAALGAAVALGIPAIATAIGLGAAGVSAAGAVAENKENFKNSLVLQSLPQTQTIYGFITALLIIIGAGLIGGAGKVIPVEKGLVMLAAGIIVALTSISAVFQGLVAAAGIGASAKNQDSFVPGIVFAGQVETPAIFGFIAALIILVVGLNVLG